MDAVDLLALALIIAKRFGSGSVRRTGMAVIDVEGARIRESYS